jgi:hypothetical protein
MLMVKWAVLVAGVFAGGPAVADDTPISMQIGLRTGIEDSSTVTLAEEPDRHDGLLLLGLDVDSFIDQYVLGGGVSIAGGPGAYGSVSAAAHAGLTTATRHLHATAGLELGVQSLSHICPLLHSEPCGSDVLPFTGLRGSIGYAFAHVEVALWSEVVMDLGSDRVTSGNDYNIGGHTLGGGLLIAYLRR